MTFWLLMMGCAATPSATQSAEPKPVPPPTRTPHLAAPGLDFTVRTWIGADARTGPAYVAHLPNPSLTVLPADALHPLSAFNTPNEDTYVHINGGFYDTDAQAMSLVVHDAQTHRELGAGSGIVTGPHPVRIIHRDAWQPGPTEALQSIDRIVNNGASLVSHRPDARRAARSLIAVADDGVYVAVLVHERSVTSADASVHLSGTSFLGPTLAEAADFAVQQLGATVALNLDGAVSSALVVHTPTGHFELVGEQPIINAVRLTPEPSP